MAHVLGVRGGLSVDHLVAVDDGARFDQLGGPGLFGALGGRLVSGISVRVSTTLPAGDRRFEALFDEVGVDHRFASRADTVPRLWILNSREGRRIVVTAPPGEIELESSAPAIDEEPMSSPADFYADLDGLLESSPRVRPPTSERTVVGIDPDQVSFRNEGPGYLERVAPRETVLLPSRVQLRMLDEDPRSAARQLGRTLERPVVARLDRDGMFVVTPAATWTIHDDDVRVRETTGAGDASAAAIVAALTMGADVVTACLFGASIARLALSDWGHLGLLTTDPLTSPFNHIRSTQEIHS